MLEKVANKPKMETDKEVLLIGEVHQDLSENPEAHGKIVRTLMYITQAVTLPFELKTRSRIETINSALENEPGNILLVEGGEVSLEKDDVKQCLSKSNIIIPMEAHTYFCIRNTHTIFTYSERAVFKSKRLDREFEVMMPLLKFEDRNRTAEEREEVWAHLAAKTARNPDSAIALSFILNENRVSWKVYEAVAECNLKVGIKMLAGDAHVHVSESLEELLRKEGMKVEKFEVTVSDTSNLFIKTERKTQTL